MNNVIDFERLAQKHPERLINVIEGAKDLSLDDLSYACEACETLVDHATDVRRVLLPCLEHADPAVREGAVYGLAAAFDKYPELVEMLKAMKPAEPARVRAAINYVLCGDYDGSD